MELQPDKEKEDRSFLRSKSKNGNFSKMDCKQVVAVREFREKSGFPSDIYEEHVIETEKTFV